MKMHSWTQEDDDLLKEKVEECEPIFEHFKTQNKSYTELNAWDAVAGRMLPSVCVTGAACRRRWEILKEKNSDAESDGWDRVIAMVDQYEEELAKATYDAVSKMMGKVDVLIDKVSRLIEMWEG